MKETPCLLEGDDEAYVIVTILEICGFELSETISIPTREALEKQLEFGSELMTLLDRCEIGYLEYIVLGSFILKTGAALPQDLRERIIQTADWETDKWRWKGSNKKFQEERKDILKDFQYKIRVHKPGQITDIIC